ncbi:MAG: cobalt/nickel transport system ATP-binding protein [Clostridia bacterium]|nr:cobalt/nickel transport system ATP-binding protein [Clostridia bacterium]
MSEVILEALGIEFTYPDGTRALKGVSLRIFKGKKIAILGPNGAGKTTLFLHFNGILRPDRGKIRFNGQDVSYKHASLLDLRKNVGLVFQDPDTQLFAGNVFQEISFGPLNLGLSKQEVWRRVEEAISATEIEGLKDKPTHFLSYGQKKRVALAAILAMQPRVLICDEPTAWLDSRQALRIVDLFQKINQQGVTIIFSTHDVDLAYSWADYIFIMKEGAVIGEGVPEEIFKDEALLKEAELNKPWLLDVAQFLKKKGYLAERAPLPKTKEELLRSLAGADIACSNNRLRAVP